MAAKRPPADVPSEEPILQIGEVANRTGRERVWAPSFILFTDAGEIVASGRGVPTRVAMDIHELLGNELLENQNEIIGEIFHGREHAKEGLVIWRADELDGGVLVTQELVEGVENIQLYIGDDTDNDGIANIYRTADQIANWATVATVHIGLLVRTPDKAERDVDTKTYVVAGTLIGPMGDRYQRRVFTSTVDLRN